MTMTGQGTDTQETILVFGGHGKTGRRVVERLEARGVPVRIGSRSGSPPFDWEDRSTWPAVFDGVSSAYVAYYPDIAVLGGRDAIAEVAKVALERGTRRLVLLSGRGEDEAQRAEEALAESGADWTVVRASWFMQNFSESYFLEPMLEGVLALPADQVTEPFVDTDDIADVAVAALTEPGHEGQVYEVTGPRLLRFDEAVAEIARASGREIHYQPISLEEFEAGMTEAGVPNDVVQLLSFLFTEVLDGRNEHLTDGVQRALGREPRDFADFARDAAAAGAFAGDHAGAQAA
jgi:uncharacterized protein YbjT (DUF2867 family)